jgi:hypothetical protein
MKHKYPPFSRTIILCLVFILPFQSYSQDPGTGADEAKASKSQISFGADLVSRYIFRGKDYGNSPAVQPNFSYSISGFKAGAWGSYGFVPYSQKVNDSTTVDMGNYAEFDPFVSYTFKWFTLCVTDYFTVNGLTPNSARYFDYTKNATGHTFEVSLAFAGPEKFPLQVFAGTLVYGSDKGKDADGTWGLGAENNYSTYLEAAYPFSLIGGFTLKPFIGGIPFGSAWYGPSAGIVNVGFTASKSIRITKDFSIPLYTSVITNPQSQSIFFVFGLTL